MADNTIDTLDIQVKSSTARAVKALGDLESKLSGLNKVFGNLNTGGLRNYSRELGRATAAASTLSKIKITTPSVGGLTKELGELSKIDLSGLSGVKKNLTNLSEGLSGLSKIDLSGIESKKIKELSTVASKLRDLKVPDLSGFSNEIRELASVDIKSSGINNTINAIKRLATADIGKLNPIKISMIGNSLKSLARVPDVSSNLNRFVSSFAKLAQAGGKTGQAASGFADLGRQVRKTITNLSGVGEISESLNLFIQSIGRLASAGGKAGQTAGGLKSLATETRGFFEVMKNAPKISENTIQMTQALAQLASAGGRVNTAANTISSSFSKLSTAGKVAKASFNVLVKTTKFAASQIMKLSGKIVSAFKSITSSSHGLRAASLNMGTLLKTALGFRAVQGLWNFGKTAIEAGSNVAEVQNIVDTAFGSMTGMVDEFASTAIEKFGLSELAAKNYAGTMMAMLNSTGVAKDAASEMSITLAGLAGDLASFYNISANEAFTAIRAGISGETEPLKRFGINMNIANINAYALANGLHKTYNEMTLSEQAMIRYNYLMAATSQQQGDFAKTSANWANQVRILAMNFQQLASILGQGLIAAILPAVQALNALMGKLIQVAKVFRDFVYALMGKSVEGSQGGIVNDYTSTGLENLGTAGGDAASGMDDATDSAQKLKKALSVLSFDELNQLSESASSAGGALSGIGDGGLDDIQTPGLGGLANALDELGKTDPEIPINKWAERIRKAFLAHDWKGLGFEIADGLNKGLQKIYDVISWKNVGPKITAFTTAFTQTFNSLVEYFDWDLLGRTIGAGVNTIVNSLNQLADGIDWVNLGSKMAEGFNGLFDEIDWYNLGHLIGNKFRIAWDMFAGFVKDLDYADIGRSVAELLTGAFETVSFGNIGTALSNLMNGAFESLRTFTETFEWQDFADNVAEGISNFLQNTEWKENGEALGDFLLHLVDALKSVLTNDTFYEFGKSVGEFLGGLPWVELLKSAAELIVGGLSSAFEGLSESGTAGSIAAFAGKAFIAVKVADITGISTLAKRLIKHMSDKTKSKENIDMMTEAFKSIFATSSENASTIVTEELGKIGSSVDEVGGKATKTGGFLSTLKTILTGNGPVSGTAGVIGALDLFNKGQQEAELYSGGAFEAISVVGNAIMEAGEKSDASTWKMSQLQSQLSGFQMGSETFEESFYKIIENLDEAGISSDDFKIALGNAMQQVGLTTGEYSGVIQTYIGQVGKSFDNSAKKSDSMKNTVTNATSTMKKEVENNLSGVQSAAETSFNAIDDATITSWGSSAAEVKKNLDQMKQAAAMKLAEMTETVRSYSKSMYNIMSEKWEQLSDQIVRIIKEMKSEVSRAFSDMTNGLKESATNSVNSIASRFSSLPRKISGSLGENMYNAGRNAASSFANGISSVHIPMPHISVDSYATASNGGYSYRMSSSVNWYKTGGLFNTPSVIGVGEAGKEAVLPLENRRTMSMIADSILSNSRSMGMDEKVLTNAVARGVAMAMMNNQQSPINVTCYAELRTEDNEVLARAVTKGQQSLDYRMHPTPQF